jgi:prepilin-type N-terminal cleavage/methylation domain-containing protein
MATIPINLDQEIANRELQIADSKLRVQGSGFGVRDTCVGNLGSGFKTLRAALSEPVPPKQFRIQHSSLILHRSPLPRPRGFTLLEVLLTLCLIVVISAMAWPQLDKTFSNQRLRKAADIVRTQWCKARVDAMRFGSIRVFRYEVGGNRYRIDMLSTDPMALLTGTTLDPSSNNSAQTGNAIAVTAASFTDPGAQRTLNSAGDQAFMFQQVLPKDIAFVSSQTDLDAVAAAAASTTGTTTAVDPTLAASVPASGTGWSEPIFFYPDGTSSNTQLMLRNKEGRTINLMLRGLTGIVKVGNITAGQTGL